MNREEVAERLGWFSCPEESELLDKVVAIVADAASAEREACAKVCDGLHDTEETFYRWVPDGRAALMEAAAAIRARGEA